MLAFENVEIDSAAAAVPRHHQPGSKSQVVSQEQIVSASLCSCRPTLSSGGVFLQLPEQGSQSALYRYICPKQFGSVLFAICQHLLSFVLRGSVCGWGSASPFRQLD